MSPCPVCLCEDHVPLESREPVPVLQNVIVETEATARDFPTARLRMVSCECCGFVWNAAFDAAAIDYGHDYNNSVQASAVYLRHQKAMQEKVLAVPGALHYLEIGCGEGEFIEALDKSGRLATAVGFDPAFHGQRAFGSHVTIHRECFNRETAAKVPDSINVVCSRHTIEHIPNPRDFIRDIAAFVRERDLTLFLETPDVTWILENLAFEDFFYEHCSLFSPHSMKVLLSEFGLEAKIQSVYDGQYMWIEARPGPARPQGQPDLHLNRAFSGKLRSELDHWRDQIDRLSARGSVAIWGAASKGVTFALLTGKIDVAIDLNPSKQNCFLPVTGIPILSPEAAKARGVASFIVMNPNYEAEIRACAAAMGWDAEICCLHASEPNLGIGATRLPPYQSGTLASQGVTAS